MIGLLKHVNISSLTTISGIGIDYDGQLIKTALLNSGTAGVRAKWLIYDFNEDQNDLVHQLIGIHGVTHLFIYLLPKQLELQTVRRILTRLWEGGVTVCCYKYQPRYLVPARLDKVMELVVYQRVSGAALG